MKILPLAILATTASFLISCGSQSEEQLSTSPPTETEEGSCCSSHPTLPAAEIETISEDSIYQLESAWKDQTGKDRDLKSLAGKIQVLTMGYTTCKYACPRLLADMRAIEDGLPEDIRNETGFVFVSIDPERDTPQRLAEYEKESEVDPTRWTMLTAETPSVQELAVVLGIQYRKVDDTDFAHSNLITVLSVQGEILYRQEGLGAAPAKAIQAILDAQ